MIQLDGEGKSHIYFCVLFEANQKPNIFGGQAKDRKKKNVTVYVCENYSRKSRHFITAVTGARGVSLQLLFCSNYHKSTLWNEETAAIRSSD